ncbi:transcription factor E2F7 [Pelobates cultripes]|uniref:Transcription factor E2F7 n=1 Tax=Pelobates cultripes TaxID=61616 RepID=A0AAD1VZM4_PELCU|nr:transcription factor E2F7 [Pelobates cultripes]
MGTMKKEMEVMNCLTLNDLVSTKKTKVDDVIDDRSAQKSFLFTKENVFDRYISPRALLKAEPIDLSKQKYFIPERSPVTPVKIVDRPQADPWTPTANLKILMSAASPEIRDREKKKELFRPIENNEPEDTAQDFQFEVADDLDELEKRPSRKQKSLGLLCQKFLSRYPSHPMATEKTNISLDEAASSLGVERRRIYDIVNVLESLHLVSRVAKNQYCWNGQSNLNETLKRLQIDGEKQKYGVLINHFQHKDHAMANKCEKQNKDLSVDSQTVGLLELSEADCPSASASSRKDKSLRIMSKKFVMLFLVSTSKIITLEMAAKILIEESQDSTDHSKFKTKVRRLYDIANVLTSLRLIKKVHVTEERGRKPAFKWIGPVDFGADSDETMEVTSTTPSPVSERDSCSIHPSFSKVPSNNTVKRKICSEPISLLKTQNVCIQSTDTYSSKMAHLAAICRQEIEDDTKTSASLTMENVGPLPFCVMPVPVDPDCFKSVAPQGSCASLKGINGHIPIVATSQFNREPGNQGFLQNQPYVYLPSNSVFMLCGNSRQELNNKSPISEQKYTNENLHQSKKRRTDVDESPLSLVLPKHREKSPDNLVFDTSVLEKSQSLFEENKKNRTANTQNNVEHVTEAKETNGLMDSNRVPQDTFRPSTLQQFLYIPSAGVNGLEFLFPASGAPRDLVSSQGSLASLGVPCVMVPSTALQAYPFFCSQMASNSLPSSSNGLSSSPGFMNYNIPHGTSPCPLIGNTTSLPAHKPETPSDLSPNASPVPVSGSSSVGSDCVQNAVPKSQKSPTPLTPKSSHLIHTETFFKTPGSLQPSSSTWKSKRTKTRSSFSAQRRLEIASD